MEFISTDPYGFTAARLLLLLLFHTWCITFLEHWILLDPPLTCLQSPFTHYPVWSQCGTPPVEPRNPSSVSPLQGFSLAMGHAHVCVWPTLM